MTSRIAVALCVSVAALSSPLVSRADDPKPDEKRPVDIVSKVEGFATIISLAPAGSQVKKGDVICELDTSVLRDNLINQEITVKRAFADVEGAEKAHSVAEIAAAETKASLDVESGVLKGEMMIAESDCAAARDKLEAAKKAKSDADVLAANRELQRSEIALKNAKGKWKVLQNFTILRRRTECEAAVKKARADVLAREAAHALAQSIEKKIRRQIDLCKIVSPIDGKFVYAQRGDSPRPVIEINAQVRERQLIGRVIPQ